MSAFDISIHALLAESDAKGSTVGGAREISIHALLAESDRSANCNCRSARPISIHALLAESDPGKVRVVEPGLVFLSTLSLRRATETLVPRQCQKDLFLSTLSLRRATAQHFTTLHNILISIHALLAESDAVMDNIVFVPGKFLSTLSLRRATTHPITILVRVVISIHALLAESDASEGADTGHKMNFYPRSPCGERPPIH